MPMFTFNISTRMGEDQFGALMQKLERIQKVMALNFSEFSAALAEVQADVQNVIRKLNEPDTDAQAKIDAATEALRGVNAALDAVAPDPTPEPAPEPASEPVAEPGADTPQG